jgi:hypothetical protein
MGRAGCRSPRLHDGAFPILFSSPTFAAAANMSPQSNHKNIMSRPVTLFTGQWADLPLEKLAPLAAEMGYDGLELACWGDHFDVDAAVSKKSYVKEKWELLSDHGLTSYAISSHLVGQAICDNIDERHKAILPPDVCRR